MEERRMVGWDCVRSAVRSERGAEGAGESGWEWEGGGVD